MSVHGGTEQPHVAPPLPTSIWVVAWASLAGQAVFLVQHGVRDDSELSLVVSVVLSALVLGYVSAGVVRARMVRFVLALVALSLILVAELVGLIWVDGLTGTAVLLSSLATTVVSLAALVRFSRTDWFSWQRTKPPPRQGASILPLVAIGVIVGVIGGVIGPVDNGFEVRIEVLGR